MARDRGQRDNDASVAARDAREAERRAAQEQARQANRARIAADIERVKADIGTLKTAQQEQQDLIDFFGQPQPGEQFGLPYVPENNPFVDPGFDFSPVAFEPTTQAINQPTREGPQAAFNIPVGEEPGTGNQPRGVSRVSEDNRVTIRPLVGNTAQDIIAARLTRNLGTAGRF